ncbi:MAG: hypothetical protein ACFCBU_09555 [Cyanophyceae cyanobacterium]
MPHSSNGLRLRSPIPQHHRAYVRDPSPPISRPGPAGKALTPELQRPQTPPIL